LAARPATANQIAADGARGKIFARRWLLRQEKGYETDHQLERDQESCTNPARPASVS
jgi:hypothetical protein